MGILERWDRRNQRLMEFANDQASPDDWFKGFPSLKQLAVLYIATEIAGVLLRAVLGWVSSTTTMALAAVAFFAVAVRQHRRRRREWEQAHQRDDGARLHKRLKDASPEG